MGGDFSITRGETSQIMSGSKMVALVSLAATALPSAADRCRFPDFAVARRRCYIRQEIANFFTE